MERLPKVGDLVKFKTHCVPSYKWAERDFVYLVSEHWGCFVRLHSAPSFSISRDNFEIISEAPKEV